MTFRCRIGIHQLPKKQWGKYAECTKCETVFYCRFVGDSLLGWIKSKEKGP